MEVSKVTKSLKHKRAAEFRNSLRTASLSRIKRRVSSRNIRASIPGQEIPTNAPRSDLPTLITTAQSGSDIIDIIFGWDFGYDRSKLSYVLRRRDKGIRLSDIVTYENWRYAPPRGRESGCYVPTATLFRRIEGLHSRIYGWEAHCKAGQDLSGSRSSQSYVARMKPRERFPESTQSMLEIPEIQSNAPTPECWSDEKREALRHLQSAGFIEKEEDVIIQYLEWMLRSIKDDRDGPFYGEGLSHESRVIFSITCPATWDRRARAQFKRLVAVAAQKVDLGERSWAPFGQINGPNDEEDYQDEQPHLLHVYMFTEPEAAATYLLARLCELKQIEPIAEKCFVIMDVGGGTTDVAAYWTETGDEFHKMTGTPAGSNCGAHMLNERVEMIIMERLDPQRRNIEKLYGNKPLRQIVCELVFERFEHQEKTTLEYEVLCREDAMSDIIFIVAGYKPPQHIENGWPGEPIPTGQLKIEGREVWRRVFKPWLQQNARLLVEQLSSYASERASMNVFIVGGGADQPALRSYIQNEVVEPWNETKSTTIRIVETPITRLSGTFVSKGAVLAAAGSQTICRWTAEVNYCILLQELYDSRDDNESRVECLRRGRRVRDKDVKKHQERVPNVPTWIIRQGQEYSSDQIFEDVESIHVFYDVEDKWIIHETIGAKTGSAKDWFPISDEHNRGHAIIQTIEDDVKAVLLGTQIRGRVMMQSIDNEGNYTTGEKRRTMKYTVNTVIRSKMRGMDWIITSEWRDPRTREWIELARRVINIADSLSISTIRRTLT